MSFGLDSEFLMKLLESEKEEPFVRAHQKYESTFLEEQEQSTRVFSTSHILESYTDDRENELGDYDSSIHRNQVYNPVLNGDWIRRDGKPRLRITIPLVRSQELIILESDAFDNRLSFKHDQSFCGSSARNMDLCFRSILLTPKKGTAIVHGLED